MLSVCTGLCTLLCAVALGLSLLTGPKVQRADAWSLQSPLIDQSLRLYGIVIAVVGLVAETEFLPLMHAAPILSSWVFRGVYHLGLSLFTLKLSTPSLDLEDDFIKSIKLYRRVAGTSLAACGGLYFMAGILCLNVLKRRAEKSMMERVRLEQTLYELEKRRAELSKLLQSE